MFVAIVAILQPWEKNQEYDRTHPMILTSMNALTLLVMWEKSILLAGPHLLSILHLVAERMPTEMALSILQSSVSLALYLRCSRIPGRFMISLSPLDGILNPCFLSPFQQIHFLPMQLCSTTWGHQLSLFTKAPTTQSGSRWQTSMKDVGQRRVSTVSTT